MKIILSGAGLVVVIAGLKAAQDLLVPFLMAVFITVILGPLLSWLKGKKVPTWTALVLIVAGICVLGLLTGALLGASINDFSRSLPQYQEKIQAHFSGLTALLGRFGLNIPERQILQYVDPGAAMNLAGLLLTSLGALLSNTFLILLTVVFILLEAASFPAKLHSAFGSCTELLRYLEVVIGKINRYMVIKTWVSLATGLLLAAWLALLGVDYPLLWGLLAFIFNYVPNIGSFIAAVPPLLLALVQLGGGSALLVAAGYVAVNMVLGNFLEPRLMGQRLGLSTLVVFLSLVFWGWVLGPVGMLLSVPLTMAAVIGLSSSPQTAWLGVLLSSSPMKPGADKE
jgi:predicted PurR-regulated permease PerM